MPDSWMIDVDAVSKSYGTGEVEISVLKDTTLKVPEGGSLLILGASGCGKTTLLNLIGALDRPDSGRITVDGEEITHLDRWERTDFRRRKIGFIFQFYNLLPTLTAQENVEAVLELVGLRGEELYEKAKEYLEAVGLRGKERRFPAQLSGGEQQRVAIARALAKEPRVILADEPTGNLDERTSGTIVDLIGHLRKEFQTTLVLVSHNPQLDRIADRVVELHLGKIVEDRKGRRT